MEQGDGLKKIMDEEAADAHVETRQAWLMRLRALFGPLLVALSAGMMALVYGEEITTDLRVELGSGDSGSLGDFELRVLSVAKRVLSGGPVNLTDFHQQISTGEKLTSGDSRSPTARSASNRKS